MIVSHGIVKVGGFNSGLSGARSKGQDLGPREQHSVQMGERPGPGPRHAPATNASCNLVFAAILRSSFPIPLLC